MGARIREKSALTMQCRWRLLSVAWRVLALLKLS